MGKVNKKNRPRYSQNEKKTDRELLSYEEVPLDDYENEDPKVTKYAVKKILKVALVLFVAAFLVFLFANREKLTYENITSWIQYELLGGNKGDGYPVSIVGTTVSEGNFKTRDSFLSYASDTSFVTLSGGGYRISATQHSFSKPIVVNSNNKYLVYNLNGTGFMINSLEENLYTADAPDKLFTADINSNGYYALVTQSDGYLSKLYVYNNSNKQIFAYSFADYYITSVTLNSSGSGAVACGISAYNGAVQSAVYYLDFKSEKPVFVKKFDNNTLYSVKYLSTGTVSVIGSEASYVINLSSGDVAATGYEEMLLTGYDINTDTGCFVTSLSRSGDGRLCTINYFNSNGEITGTIDTDLKITSISLYKDKIAVLSQGVVYVYNREGELLNTVNPGTDARAVRIFSDNNAYILGIGEIRMVDFTNDALKEQEETIAFTAPSDANQSVASGDER